VLIELYPQVLQNVRGIITVSYRFKPTNFFVFIVKLYINNIVCLLLIVMRTRGTTSSSKHIWCGKLFIELFKSIGVVMALFPFSRFGFILCKCITRDKE